jgi:hypothetical protein
MKADKFWMTALAAVATAGTIGVAVAQNVQQPNQGAQGNTQATTEQGTPAAQNPASTTPMAANSTSTDASSSANSSASSSGMPSDSSANTVAQADRG